MITSRIAVRSKFDLMAPACWDSWRPLCFALLGLISVSTQAASLYWDANGTSGGAGSTPAGIWGTDSYWNTTAAGNITAPGAWIGGETAVFSAGGDATGIFTVTLNGAQTAAGLMFEEGSATLAGDGLALSSPSVTLNSGAKAVINSSISGSSGLVKAGVGELVLGGANSFTGGLVFQRGTLTMDHNDGASTGAIIFTNLGSTLFRSTLSVTLTNAINLGVANGNSLDIAASSGQTLSLNGPMSNSHGWNVNGAGTVLLGGNAVNNYGGLVTVLQGTLALAKDSALGSTSGGTVVSSGATLGFQGGFQYQVLEGLTISGSGVGGAGAILNLGGQNEFWGSVSLSGASRIGAESGSSLGFIGTVSGAEALTKVGSGQVNLFNSGNNYTTTLVSEGTFGVWYPANAGTGLATVSSGATLIGNGDVPGGIDLSGTLVVGNISPDQLDSGTQTWRPGGVFVWKVNDFAGMAGTDPGWDWLNITGSLDLGSLSPGDFTLNIVSLNPAYSLGDAASFDNTQETNRIIATATAGIAGFAANKFVLATNNFSNDQGGGRFVILTSGNDLVLRFDPPPMIVVCTNITQGNDLNQCGASVAFAAVATDNRPGVLLTYATNGLPVISGTIFPLGTTTVDVTATDSVGNTDTCSFNVTVNDTQAPTVITKNITVQLDATGNTNIVPADVNDGSFDFCSSVTLVSVTPNAFNFCDVGANPVVLTVADGNGNTNTAGATVTVTAPVAAPAVVYVDDDYPATCDAVNFPDDNNPGPYLVGFNAFSTIQSAVNAVAVGGTVHVASGTYPERVVVNKTGVSLQGAGINSIVTGTLSLPVAGVTPTIFKVAASNVTINNFKVLVDFTYDHSGVHSSGNCAGITVSSNTIVATVSVTNTFGYGLRNAIGINPSISVVGYSYDNTGYGGVAVIANSIQGTGPTYFRAGIQMDLCGGVISGNTSTTINHDFITRFANQGDITVSGNAFLGGGANIGSFNSGAGTVTITNNVFDNSVMQPATGSLPTSASLRLIYFAEVGSVNNNVVVVGNTFTNHRWAVSAEDFKNVTFDNNTFTPKAGATDFVHISFNTKIAASTSASAINMFPVGATLTRNSFNGSGSAGGIALAFYNHRSTNAVFGTFTLGTPGNENEFSSELGQFIEMDASSGPSTGWTRFGGYGTTPSTSMAPWPTDINAQNNKFDVGSGMTLASGLSLPEMFRVEDRMQHKLDISSLGLVRVKAASLHVTASSGSIQRGIDAATAGDTITVTNGTFTENVTLNKQVAVVGAGSSAGGTVIATAAGPSTSGLVQVSASGSLGSPVGLKNVRILPVGRAGISVGLFGASSGTLVDYLSLDNVQVIGSNLTPCTEQERGLYVDLTSSLLHLTVTNCAFDNLHYGWYLQKAVSADTSTVRFVTVHATSFSHNNLKGVYAEKLSDATFTCSTVTSNGYDGGLLSGCSFFQPFLAGFDVNLKAGTYANLTFQDCDFEDNALGGAINGVALALKGRGTGSDSATYLPFPATLSNVIVAGCLFDGNERSIQLGEPGKANTTPTGVMIANSSLAPAATGVALRNEMAASVPVVATNNWWGNLSGPAIASNVGGAGAQILGGTTVDYSPWLGDMLNLGISCAGFQPDPVTAVLYSPTALAFSVQPGDAGLGALLSTQPVVSVLNEISQVATQYNGPVTVALGVNPGSGVLTGTLTVNAVAGVATFTNLAVTVGGGTGFALLATAPSPIAATNSAAFDIANPSPSLLTLNPAGAVTGSGGGSNNIVLTGSGFVPTSIVLADGIPVSTTFNSSSQLTATLSTVTPGSYSVVVSNLPPVSGSAVSGALTFTVGGMPTVVYVDDDFGPGNSGSYSWGYNAFSSIPGGIAAVTNGGTVNVLAGTYPGVNINKPVTLLGVDNFPCGGTNSLIDAGSGVAVTIAANDVTVKGFGLKGVTGLSNTGFAGLVAENNHVDAGALGLSLVGVNGGFSVKDNCINLPAPEVGMPYVTNITIGILFGTISGSGQVVSGNNISGPLYGYLLADVDAAFPLRIHGGTVYNAMQGVAVINYDLASVPQNSTFTVDSVNMSGFSGTSLDLSRNFHAGVYVFTGGSNPSATVAGTITNVTVAGTGKISADSAGLSFADFSTSSVGVRQNITVVNSLIQNNLNRGINVRGSNAVVTVTGATLEDNGFDPYGLGGNGGFGLIARNGSQVTVTGSVIINPAAQTNYTVTALVADGNTAPEGPTLIVSNNAIENNGNPAGKLAQRSAGTFNASGNWWGETSDATIASLMTGSVDFSPYLADWTDTDAAHGFQGDFSSLKVTALLSQTGTTPRIQEGVDLIADGALLAGNRLVDVQAGTYVGEVLVDRAVKVHGPNVGINPNTGSRVAEAVLLPATSDPNPNTSSVVLLYVSSDDVSVRGLKLDGDNPGLTSGVIMRGVDVDAIEAIASYEGVGNITASENIIHNTSYSGVDFYNWVNAGGATSGNHIQDNKLNNIGHVPYGFGIGIVIYNNFYAEVSGNVMTDVRLGVQTGNFSQPNPGTTQSIHHNTIASTRRGVFHNLAYSGASTFAIYQNAFTSVDEAGSSRWDGIMLSSIATPVSVVVQSNSITASSITQTTVGYQVWNNSANVTIEGGSVVAADYGVWVNNYDGYGPSDGGSTHVTVASAILTGSTLAGVYVKDNALNGNGATVTATVSGNTSITGSPIGVLVEGVDAHAIVANNFASITGNGVGIDIDAGRALIENNNLTGNTTAAIRASNGAIADAGACSLADITGLGISSGGNDLTGYLAGPAKAVINSGSTVRAYGNSFGAVTGQALTPALTGNVSASQSGGLLVTPLLIGSAVECPGDIPPAVTNLAGFVGLGGVVSATDGITVTSTDGLLTGPTEGTVTRTYTLADVCGQTNTATQIFTVNDTVAPLVTIWPTNRTLQVGANCDVPIPDLTGEVVAADNCAPIVHVSQSQTNDLITVGTTFVTVTASDDGGNFTNHVVTLTVVDTTLPTVNAPAAITNSNDPGLCSASVAFAAAPSDNCGVASTGYFIGLTPITSPYAFDVGSTPVTVRVIDIHGNTNTAGFTVTVNDTEAPHLTAGSFASCYHTQTEAEVAATNATLIVENCGIASIVASTTGDPCAATITVTVVDIHGNTNSLAYNTRIDNEAPTLGVITATQFAGNVKNTNTVLQGVVNISVAAGENCGLDGGHPSIQLVNGTSTNYAVCVATNGPGPNTYQYLYEWTVLNSTSNGLWTATVSASDLCETTNTTFTLYVNKSQITGLVQLESFIGTGTGHSRVVVFKATTNSATVTNVVATWTKTLTNASGDTFAYTLTDVPPGTTGLSAKTDWNLRSRLVVAMDGNGQAVADFTGPDQLPGGDVTGDNEIFLPDYLIIGNAFYTVDPSADVDGSGGVIGLDDYLYLYLHWFTGGDPE